MIGALNANALTAASLADFAALELHAQGLKGNDAEICEAAAACVPVLLRAAVIALELAGVCDEDSGGGVHDVILDYIHMSERDAHAAREPVA